MGVRAQALAWLALPSEVVELVLAQTPLEEGPRVDPWRGVALLEDLVSGRAIVLAKEEVVEADLVQARRAGIRREVTADPRVAVVRAQDHRDRVPADDASDAQLHRLVAREGGLLFRADRIDVARLGQRRQAQVELARALERAVEDELRAGASFVGDDRIQQKMQGQVSPETWTHGSAAMRRQWLAQGFNTGDPNKCDTFARNALN